MLTAYENRHRMKEIKTLLGAMALTTLEALCGSLILSHETF
jgi:hypothetical protein